MILYILVGVAVVIAGFVSYDNIWKDQGWRDGIGTGIVLTGCIYALAAVFTFIACLVSVMVATLFAGTVDRVESSNELQAVDTGSQVGGTFFLGTGSVDGDTVFNYYYKTDGGFRMDYQYASDVLVVEDSTQPRIVTVGEYFPTWITPNWFGAFDTHYVIHVPKGSVKPMINMNLPGN